jgi:hypothetical protein
MEFLSAGGWGLFLFALVAVATLATLAGIGVGVIFKDRGPRS